MSAGRKITKVEAGYGDSKAPRVRCGTCSMFQPPRACTLVQGDISAASVCDFWESKSAAAATRKDEA